MKLRTKSRISIALCVAMILLIPATKAIHDIYAQSIFFCAIAVVGIFSFAFSITYAIDADEKEERKLL